MGDIGKGEDTGRGREHGQDRTLGKKKSQELGVGVGYN